MRALSIVALLAGVVLAGCSLIPSPTPPPTFVVSNGTTLDVTVVVNGRAIGVFPASGAGPTIDPSSLGAFPWAVEARSPSGRVLLTMPVEQGKVSYVAHPDGTIETSSAFGRVDLSCGMLLMWYGYPGGGGPAPDPSASHEPGDCDP